ncbi:NACHT domain-containing protein [Streptomyces sp. NBC_01381]|uniref:NACHT domain-containing protein n=1 Tax=Streptomyces sp. NBC_01381 TaxID=2903845 RepID=UPI0022574C8E|nr:NACHT domain-containing protein [Streptomyces sp. NBC_01381]MCX4665371.1 NACHT domain-containing protein [Streptomyces sp. NBC_01381]
MDPVVIGTRLASAAVTPLIKKLFVREGPGAGLVDRPVRLSGLVSFRGEKRTLTQQDLAKLAAALVRQALRTGEPAITANEERAVADALTCTLHALGDLTLSDVEAVELGHGALAARLRQAAGRPDRDLSADATYFYERLLDTTCLHILHFFTQRSTFVAATLVAQSRRQAELIAKADELIARSPLPGAEDVAFEQRYLAYVAKKHGKLTIFGIDLANSPGRWPLDAAYMSLEATGRFILQARSPEQYALALAESGPPGPRPADQALTTHERVLLRGEAGSGKSTLVQWLAVSTAGGPAAEDRMAYLHDRVPYVLPLRTLTRHGERLPAPADFLASVGSPLAGTQPSGWESRVLTAGRALVLVDGIDEIPESERARTRTWLTDLIDAYPGNRWLVTSRPSAVREDWLAEEGFTELTLSEMSRVDVAAFIGRWHAAAATGVPDEDAALASYEKQLLGAVSSKPDLGRLATNPLMCGLICALHRDRRGFLPLSRKDLYAAALSMLLVRRDRERHMDVPELREEPQLQILQRLAYWLIRNGRTEMDRSRAEAIIGDVLPAVPEVAALGDAAEVYAHFLHRSGLLREPAPDTVGFVHRTFQDFLGARAVLDEGDFGLLVGNAADDQWADVIQMTVAQARPRERVEIFRDLLASGDQNPADSLARMRIHLLAAVCLEHAAELEQGVRGEVERRVREHIPPLSAENARALAGVGPLVLDLLPGPDALSDEEARHVATTATHIRSDAAIPFLARFARHPSIGARSQLMWGWSRYDRRLYAEQVISRLNDGVTNFVFRSDEDVAEVERLDLRPERLDIREGVSAEGVSSLLVACAPTFLILELPPPRLTAEAIDALRDLTALRFFDIDEPWDLSLIPPRTPLRTLGFIKSLGALTDFHHISTWPGLEWIALGANDHLTTAAEWETLACLPRLSELSLSSHSLACAPPGTILRGVRTLRLHPAPDRDTTTARVPSLLPELTSLHVLRPTGHGTAVDVTALADHPTLAHLRAPTPGTTGLEALPAHIEVVAYPPITD